MEELGVFVYVLDVLAVLFIFAVCSAVLALIALYVVDRRQTEQAIRHNHPVIGRLRYVFEHLGKFFRQYFFAMDREELPFNRSERSWVYRAAKNADNTTAFGSTRDLRPQGSVFFVNCPFPTLNADATPIGAVTIGPQCVQPYTTHSLITTHDPRLQRGLNPQSKSERVANYVRNMLHEVGVIAHACGVREPRELQRFLARIVTESGHSLPLDEAYRLGQVNRAITSGDPK